MLPQHRSLLLGRYEHWLTSLAIVLVVLTVSATTSGWPQSPQSAVQSAEVGLQITLPDDSRPHIRFESGGATLIPRNRLRLIDLSAAAELTAIDVRANREGDAMRVRLSIIYNDISNQEWWKDKKEKVAGSYLIRAGETIRPLELEQFGIEPFEMKGIDANPVVLKPGKGPRITNSAALEVDRVERHFDNYRLWLKNRSSKNIVAYTISIGNSGRSTEGVGYGPVNTVLAAGAVSREMYFSEPELELGGLTVKLVLFEDGSFEGDPKLAAQLLAKAEGVKIQSPRVLRMIEQALKVDDSDLRAAFDKLEADLWVIPEAIDKPSALEFLKTKFPSADEKTRMALYEDLKGGLYNARNIALSSIGDTRRSVQELESRSQFASAVESIRRVLERLKETFDKITAAQR